MGIRRCKDCEELISPSAPTDRCSICYAKYLRSKHEEIKQKAWDIFIRFNDGPEAKFYMSEAWELAEEFYNYAKEQEETNDGN